MPEDGHDRGPGEPSSSVAARHSFTPRQTAKLKRTMQPVLASILHPLRCVPPRARATARARTPFLCIVYDFLYIVTSPWPARAGPWATRTSTCCRRRRSRAFPRSCRTTAASIADIGEVVTYSLSPRCRDARGSRWGGVATRPGFCTLYSLRAPPPQRPRRCPGCGIGRGWHPRVLHRRRAPVARPRPPLPVRTPAPSGEL